MVRKLLIWTSNSVDISGEGYYLPENVTLESLAAVENLRSCWEKAVAYSRYQEIFSFDHEIAEFEEFFEANLEAVGWELLEGTYEPGRPVLLDVPKKDGSRRQLCFFNPVDSMVSTAIVSMIGPIFEEDFSDSSYGHRLATGIDAQDFVFRRWVKQYSKYTDEIREFASLPGPHAFLRFDVKDFYPKICLPALRGLLRAKVHDQRIVELIEKFLTRVASSSGSRNRGLPQSPALGHFLSNVYLDSLDKVLEANCDRYARYVDDVVAVYPSLEAALRAEKQISGFLDGIHLSLNPDKTDYGPIKELGNQLDKIIEEGYDLRLSLSREVDEEKRKELYSVFGDLLNNVALAVGKDGVMKHVSIFLENSEQKFGREHTLKCIDEMLQGEPVRPNSARAIFMTLLRLTEGDIPHSHLETIKRLSPHMGILFIQCLDTLAEPGDAITEVVRGFVESPAEALRASAIDWIVRNSHDVAGNELINVLQSDRSVLVKRRCLASLAKTPEFQIEPHVIWALSSRDPELSRSAYWLLFSIDNSILSQSCVLSTQPEPEGMLDYVPMTYVCLQTRNEATTRFLLEKSASMTESQCLVINEIAFLDLQRRWVLDGDMGSIAQSARLADWASAYPSFSDTYARLSLLTVSGLVEESLEDLGTTREQLLGPIVRDEPHLDLVDDRLVINGEYLVESALPYFPKRECFHLCCRRVADGSEFILEVIDGDVFAQDSFADWSRRIANLSGAGFSTATTTFGLQLRGKDYHSIAYEVPPGYRLLREIRQSGGISTEDEVVVLLREALTKLDMANSVIPGIHHMCAYNILVRSADEVRFINLTANRFDPLYASLADGDIFHGIMPTAPFVFASLLGSELLTGQNPRKAIVLSGFRKSSISHLHEIEALKPTMMHFRRFLRKSCQATPQYRYRTFGPAVQDLTHLMNLRESVRDIETGIGHEWAGLAEFLDYANVDCENRLLLGLSLEEHSPSLALLSKTCSDILDRLLEEVESKSVFVPEELCRDARFCVDLPFREIVRTKGVSVISQQLFRCSTVISTAVGEIESKLKDMRIGLRLGHTFPSVVLLLALKLEIVSATRALLLQRMDFGRGASEVLDLVAAVISQAKVGMAERSIGILEQNLGGFTVRISLEVLLDLEETLDGIRRGAPERWLRGLEGSSLLLAVWCLLRVLLKKSDLDTTTRVPTKGLAISATSCRRFIKAIIDLKKVENRARVSGGLTRANMLRWLRGQFLENPFHSRKANTHKRGFATVSEYDQIHGLGYVRLSGVMRKNRRFRKECILRGSHGEPVTPGCVVTADIGKIRPKVINVMPTSERIDKLMFSESRGSSLLRPPSLILAQFTIGFFVFVMLLAFGLVFFPQEPYFAIYIMATMLLGALSALFVVGPIQGKLERGKLLLKKHLWKG